MPAACTGQQQHSTTLFEWTSYLCNFRRPCLQSSKAASPVSHWETYCSLSPFWWQFLSSAGQEGGRVGNLSPYAPPRPPKKGMRLFCSFSPASLAPSWASRSCVPDQVLICLAGEPPYLPRVGHERKVHAAARGGGPGEAGAQVVFHIPTACVAPLLLHLCRRRCSRARSAEQSKHTPGQRPQAGGRRARQACQSMCRAMQAKMSTSTHQLHVSLAARTRPEYTAK